MHLRNGNADTRSVKGPDRIGIKQLLAGQPDEMKSITKSTRVAQRLSADPSMYCGLTPAGKRVSLQIDFQPRLVILNVGLCMQASVGDDRCRNGCSLELDICFAVSSLISNDRLALQSHVQDM